MENIIRKQWRKFHLHWVIGFILSLTTILRNL